MRSFVRCPVSFSLAASFSLYLATAGHAFARAGGGGGEVEVVVGGGILALILAPFYIAWVLLKKAKRKVEDTVHDIQLHHAAAHDPFWDEDAIKARVEKVFFTVQRAWMKRDQNIAKAYVTERLYDKHKLQTDLLIENHHINVLADMNLIEVQVVKVDDQENDAKDKMWARIRASMIDFTTNEKGECLKGNQTQSKEFVEVWKFVRGPEAWLLDEINQNVDQD